MPTLQKWSSSLQYFTYMHHTFGAVSKTSSLNSISPGLSPALSSRHFIAFLFFIIRSMVYFELIFVKTIKLVSGFIDFPCLCANIPVPLFKRLSLEWIKAPFEIFASQKGEPGFKPGSTSSSSFLLVCTLGSPRWHSSTWCLLPTWDMQTEFRLWVLVWPSRRCLQAF